MLRDFSALTPEDYLLNAQKLHEDGMYEASTNFAVMGLLSLCIGAARAMAALKLSELGEL